VLITGLKLKAFRNPQPSWGFSVHNKAIFIHQENSHTDAFNGY
ncbi:penicillin-binding protein, partial [Escherichia coli]